MFDDRVTAFMTVLSQLTHLHLQGQDTFVLHVGMDGIKMRCHYPPALPHFPEKQRTKLAPFPTPLKISLHS